MTRNRRLHPLVLWFFILILPLLLALVIPKARTTYSDEQPDVTNRPLENAGTAKDLYQPVIAQENELSSASSTSSSLQNVESIGQIGGTTQATAAQGNYAYVGKGPVLVILDMTNGEAPVVVGKTVPLPGLVESLAVAGNYAYVAAGEAGLRIINIANPAAPTEVGFVTTPEDVYDVAVEGNYAYVTDGSGGLYVINIANPAAPAASGFFRASWIANGLAAAGNYVYIAAGDGLHIINVANPAVPSETGVYDTPGNANGVAVAGNYAYVADGFNSGLRIINIANPAAPTEAGFYITPGEAHDVAVTANYAYVTDGSGGLRIINHADPTAPTEVGFKDVGWLATDVAVEGDYVYESGGDYGRLRITNIANPAAPTGVSFSLPVQFAHGVTVAGDYGYIIDSTLFSSLSTINIANPAVPTYISALYAGGTAQAVAAAGNYAYVATWDSGLRIFDIANPEAWTEVGFYDTPGNAVNVAVVGNYAYVADRDAGLRIINIANPAVPSEAGFYDTAGQALDVAMAGNYAYVADKEAGLRIINIANPAAPSEVGFYNTTGEAFAVAVSGDYAYVADRDEGLRIINIANPAVPSETGFYDTAGQALDVAVAGNYAYVADRDAGLRIINITNPAAPSEAGFYDTAGHAGSVAIAGDYAYVADNDGGLIILRYTGINVAPISIDFQLDRDAYRFQNPAVSPDYSRNDMISMFGVEDTCVDSASISSETICFLKPAAAWWHLGVSLGIGLCDGMTTSALRFFTGIDDPAMFQEGAQNTFALTQNNALHNISWHQVLQDVPNIGDKRIWLEPNDALQRIYQALREGHGQLANVNIVDPSLKGAHSVLPYAIEDAGNGTWRVMVYDNNSPLETHRYLLFNTSTNEYETNLNYDPGSYTGSATELLIAVTPLNIYLRRPQCPWCENTTRNSNDASNSVLSNGFNDLLITDSNGRRIGFVDGQLVNEIPNAIAAPDINGLGIEREPTYFLPHSAEYTIEMQDNGVEDLHNEEENSVSLFGPGFAASAVTIPLVSEAKDKMTVKMDGTEFSFAAGTKKEIHLALTGGETENEEYEIVDADVGGGSRVALSRNYAEEKVIINYQDAAAGEYTLALSKVTDQGETAFLHENIQIDSGDSHVVLLETWTKGSVDVCVDEIGSELLVECETLENQAIGNAIYLPTIIKSS